jgi:shikimate kinase
MEKQAEVNVFSDNSELRQKPNLYIVGFMGTGKTTVGRTVSKRLDYTFYDMDRVIEEKVGKSVVEIFEEHGDEYFRRLEREFIESGHPSGGCVVSCGGGLPIQPGMLDILKSKGLIVCLFASVDVILARTSRTQKRPLLLVEDPRTRIESLLEARRPIYLQCGTCIMTDGRTISAVANHVEKFYRNNAANWSQPISASKS